MAYQPELEKLRQRYDADPARNFAQLAEAYRRSGQLDEGLELLRMHLQDRPDYVSGLIVLGRCLVEKGEWDEARDTFEHVLSIDAEHIIALKALADLAEGRRDAPAAQQWYQRLLDIDPMNEEARDGLSRLEARGAEGEAASDATPVTGLELPETPVDEAPAIPPTVVDMPAFDPSALHSQEAAAPAEHDAAPASDEPPAAPERAPGDDLVIERASAEYDVVAADIGPVDVELSKEADLPPTVQMPGVDAGAPPSEWAPETGQAAEKSDDTVPVLPGEDSSDPSVSDAPPADGLVMESFDPDLGWDAGERSSKQVSAADIEEAERLHDENLTAAVQGLPGMENADVPDVADPAVVGSVTPEAITAIPPPVESDPIPGLVTEEVDMGAVADQAAVEGLEDAAFTPPPPESVREPVTAEIVPPVADAPAEPADEAAGDEDTERGSLAGLPVFLPDDEEAVSSGEGEPEPVVTETMAEVYARQGLVEQARDVYQRLVSARPGDARLEARLAELSDADRGTPLDARRQRHAASATGAESARAFLRRIVVASTSASEADTGGEGVAAAAAGAPVADTPAEAPPAAYPDTPMDQAFEDDGDAEETPRGAPTQPAADEMSLAAVFGDAPAPSPPAPEPARSDPETSGPVPGGFSFDEFFGAKPPDRPSGTGRTTRDTMADDEGDEAFRNWLKNLKG